MADPHQVTSIIAKAILAGRKQQGETPTPEEAKQMAKHIEEALADAGLHIVADQRVDEF